MKKLIRFFQWVVLYFKGGDEMMAMFLAQRVILGLLDFQDVPEVLKPQVYDLLDESGLAFLAGDYTKPATEEPAE